MISNTSALENSPVFRSEPTPRVQLMNVTPELAARWLMDCNTKNRCLSPQYAERLADEIRANRWVLTHEGIAFSPGNILLDGQHRLMAIQLAGKSVDLYVWFDVSAKALLAINTGKPRQLHHTLSLARVCGDVDPYRVAVLRAMIAGRGHARILSAGAAQHAMLRHDQAIEFALGQVPATIRFPGIATAVTRSIIARAWYSADRQRIANFSKVLTTGIATSVYDRPAQMLFQFLLSHRGNSESLRCERYGKTERALQAFLRGEPLAKLCAIRDEVFPLPEETTLRAKGGKAA